MTARDFNRGERQLDRLRKVITQLDLIIRDGATDGVNIDDIVGIKWSVNRETKRLVAALYPMEAC